MFSNLNNLPKTNDLFFWSDFIELHTLTHLDKLYSRGDLASLMHIEREFHLDDNCSEKKSDSYETKWMEYINYCHARKATFASNYPFKISSDLDTLELNYDEKNPYQKLYLFLLIASSLRYIEKIHMNEITHSFEKVSFQVFKKIMPKGSEVHPTWAHGDQKMRYRGKLYEKMLQLQKDLRASGSIEEDDFKPNNTGDGGIDIVAWHPMGDETEGMPISFAQCSCSQTDWRFKTSEACFSKHRQKFNVMHPWAAYYFMPLDFRKRNKWPYKSDLGEIIIVDRLRIMNLSVQYQLAKSFPDLSHVDTAYHSEII